MKNFKSFITEEDLSIEVNADQLNPHIEKLNADLDRVTGKPFTNSAVFMNAVRGTLERFGIVLPPSYVMPMLSVEAETVYKLGGTDKHLYICHGLVDGLVDGYAQIVDEEELNDLIDMDKFNEDEVADPRIEAAKRRFIPPDRRRAADDGGNTDEY